MLLIFWGRVEELYIKAKHKEVQREHEAVAVKFTVLELWKPFKQLKGVKMYQLPDDRLGILLVAQPVTAKGKPARVDGIPVWDQTLGAELFTATPSDDGLSETIVPIDDGVCQTRFTADADLGEGVVPLVGLFDFEIIEGQAVNVVFTPQELPATAKK